MFCFLCTFAICKFNTTISKNSDRINNEINSGNLDKVSYVVIVATDSDSINIPECNLLMSQIPDNYNIDFNKNSNILENVNFARIPYNHQLEINLLAFGKNDKLLGILKEPKSEIILTNLNNKKTRYIKPFQVKEDLKVTLHIEKDLTIVPLKIEIIYPHKINETNPISLYKKERTVHIINGNGPFVVVGESIEFTNNRDLKVNPHFMSYHTVFITDRCIPENKYKIEIQTFHIGSIEIIGPTQVVIGDHCQFEVNIITPDGKVLPSKLNDLFHWSTETPDLIYNKKTGFWEMNASKIGRNEIILIADDHRRSHIVHVFNKIVPKYDYLTMFVGEKLSLEFANDINEDLIQVTSSNPEIVSFENKIVAVSINTGIIQACIYFIDLPTVVNANITIHVIEAKNLILEYNETNIQTGDPVYIGSYVHIVPYIETDIGLFTPKSILWNVDGSDNWEYLHDNSILIKGDKEGTVIVSASSINNLTKSIKIYFDYKLQLKNQDNINIPLGGTYDIKNVADKIPDIQYKIIAESPQYDVDNVTINKSGQIFAGAEGKFVVIVKYKNQWKTIPLTISKPTQLFLESEKGNIIHPRILDPDYQEYTTFGNSVITFTDSNITSKSCLQFVNYNNHYVFEVPSENEGKPILITSNVSIYPKDIKLKPLWNVSHSVYLFQNNLIYPHNPIIPKGEQIQFICQAQKRDFKSSNPHVATISQSGMLYSHMKGRTIIKCTPDIKTTVTIVELKSVSLKKFNDFLYKIESNFAPSIDKNKGLKFMNNMKYKCKWDAEECGYSDHIVINGEHYCKIHFYETHLCPEISTLRADVLMAKNDIDMVALTDVKIKNTFFVIPSILTVGIPPHLKYFDFGLSFNNSSHFNLKDIGYELPPSVNLTFDINKVRLIFFPGFKGGDVIFEHRTYPKERIKLQLRIDSKIWTSPLKPAPKKYYKFINTIFVIIIITLFIIVKYLVLIYNIK